MNRKDILELKRRFKKNQCTFTKVCGCYVNGEKKILTTFRENFLNLPDEEFHKHLEIAKKSLSGGVGNNLLELNFFTDDQLQSDTQRFLMRLKVSALKDDALLEEFYNKVIDSYDYPENFLILLYHDAYDVIVKTSDNIKMDDSEEVYEYILCAICPVSLSKPGLGYFDEERKIKARIRDWVVDVPSHGFLFPGFIDRSADVNTVIYYTKNAKEPHPELMENTLGCTQKQTATIQKETFQSMVIKDASVDDTVAERLFGDIQDNLNMMVEEYKEIYEDTDVEPIILSKEKVKDLLIDSGVSEEAATKIEDAYDKNFGDEPPVAESLIDKKVLKANEQKKIEKHLMQQVEQLEQKLEVLEKESIPTEVSQVEDSEDQDTSDSDMDLLDIEDEASQANYDVVLHVKPDKLSKIKTEVINGQKCLVVPIDDDELTNINGQSHNL